MNIPKRMFQSLNSFRFLSPLQDWWRRVRSSQFATHPCCRSTPMNIYYAIILCSWAVEIWMIIYNSDNLFGKLTTTKQKSIMESFHSSKKRGVVLSSWEIFWILCQMQKWQWSSSQPTATRQAMFRQTKHFKCACQRFVIIHLQVFLIDSRVRCLDPTEFGSFVASIRCTECEEDGGQVEILLIINHE